MIIHSLKPVTAQVRIAGKNLHFVSLELSQAYGDHHHFEITLDYDMLGDDFMSDPIKHIQLIGEQVVMNFSHKNDNSDYYLFMGVVTNVKQTGHEGKKGYLVVSGSSPTIMLEKGRRMDIYSNKTLRGIFEILFEGVHSHYMKYVANPVYKNRVDFLMQYNESDWDFLKRIAYLYKENLFYSGVEILFGKYEEWEAVKLTYDKEITNLEFCSRMLPNNTEYYQYVADRNETIERQSSEKIENTNDYLDAAEKQNTILTSRKPAKSYIDAPVYDSTDISDILKREKSRNAAQTITIKGKSKTYKNTIGRLINISMPSQLSKTSNIGTYRVIKSIHRIDEKNRYSCEFEAVPASLDAMPVKEPKMPQADSVIGKIRSNEDPLNQGRVQVDFDFARNYNFSWLRVLTPNAGSSAEIPQNRGMVFIPEKGDQVMVGFEYSDPNRPYVMGSLFHGKNGKGGQADNHIKTIITRQGHTIEFDDAPDTLGITIKDKNGNSIHLDTKGKSIKIQSVEKIDLVSKEINLTANEINLSSTNTTSTSNERLALFGNKTVIMHSDEEVDIESFDMLNITAKESYIKGTDLLESSGKSVYIGANSDMLISADSCSINGESNIKINAPRIDEKMSPTSFPFKDKVVEKEILMTINNIQE